MLDAVLHFVAAMLLGVLPRRVWPPLEMRFPIREAAMISALATMFGGAALGIPSYFAYAQANADAAVEVALQSAGWRATAPSESAPSERDAQAAWAVSYTSAASFALTPLGLLSVYLFVSGFTRVLSVWTDDARGDPLLSVADAAVAAAFHRRRRRIDLETRERREGVEVEDRVTTGASAGIAAAELVVVASRRKPGWDAGTIVITADGWFRLGRPEERETPNGLRTLYPLTEVRDLEAVRKSVEYAFPPTFRLRTSRSGDAQDG